MTKPRNAYQKEKNRAWAWDDKLSTGCACGERRPWRLEYHHIQRKLKRHTMSKLINSGAALDRIIEERKLCEVMCKNCHADVEYRIRQSGLLPKQKPAPTLPGFYENKLKMRPLHIQQEELPNAALPL